MPSETSCLNLVWAVLDRASRGWHSGFTGLLRVVDALQYNLHDCIGVERVAKAIEPVRVLGIDETRRGRPRWEYCSETQRWVRVDPWDTGFVDLDGEQGLLGQRTGRTSAAVIEWLQARTPQFREAVEYVAIDPAAV